MHSPVHRRSILPDAHVGLWKNRNTHTVEERAEAAHAFVDQSNEIGSEIILNGDTVDDDRSSKKRIEEDARLFRSALVRALNRVRRTKGNHDNELDSEKAQELLGPHIYHEQEIYVDHSADLTVTHGHIFDSAKTLKRIRRLAASRIAYTQDQVITHVCDKNILSEEMKATMDMYSAMEKAEQLFSLLTRVGEPLIHIIGRNRKWLRELLQHKNVQLLKRKGLQKFMKYVDENMTPSELAAAQLAAMLGTGAATIGHTHIESVGVHTAWQHEEDDHPTVLMGNGGSLVHLGRDMTWLTLETDWEKRMQVMNLFRYDKRKHAPEIVRTAERSMDDDGPRKHLALVG